MTEAVLSIFWKMVRRTAVGHAPALPPIFFVINIQPLADC